MANKKNVSLFKQTKRKSARQISFHDFEKLQLPTLDEIQFRRLVDMRKSVGRMQYNLDTMDQLELIDIALAGVKAMYDRNTVQASLTDCQALVASCNELLVAVRQPEDKIKAFALICDLLGTPKNVEQG